MEKAAYIKRIVISHLLWYVITQAKCYAWIKTVF